MFGVQNKYQMCRFLLIVGIFNSVGVVFYFINHYQSYSPTYINLEILSYVIQFSDTKCVAISEENKLIVDFCNSDEVKPFSYDNGILKSAESGLCISAQDSRPGNLWILQLSDCEKAINLTMVEDFLVHFPQVEHTETQSCITAADKGKVLVLFLQLKASVALAPCNKIFIRTKLREESEFRGRLPTDPPVPATTEPPKECNAPSCEITGTFRIQFSYEGKCVGISKDDELVVSFCNPREVQSFSYSKGIFMSVERALCIGVKRSNSKVHELILTTCENAVRLLFIDGVLRRGPHQSDHQMCVSPLMKPLVSHFPNLGAKIALAPCQKPGSNISLLEEAEFLKDRAALLLPFPQNDSCNFPGCGINKRPEFPILLPEEEVTKCENLSDCVTIIVKTARRPYFVIRLARSVKQYLDENVPIIVIDDGPDSHPPDVMEEISRFPNIKYVISKTADVGIAEGRTRAVQMVKTKYFLSFDDDMMVPEHSGIPKMVELLDTTDLSLVGARGKTSWAGLVDFYTDEEGQQILRQLHGTCTAKRLELPFIKGCHQCDLTVMVVLARTNDILEVGGWSKELKISEHVDIFLRLKAAGKKVAICSSFQFQHDPSKNETVFNEVAYRKLRWNRMKQMSNRFLNHWNIHKFKKVST